MTVINPEATWSPSWAEKLYLLGESIGLFAMPVKVGGLAKTAEVANVSKAAEVKIPEVKIPEVKAAEVKAPEIKAPEVKTPEVKVEPKNLAPYKRPNNATTPAQRASVQGKPCVKCGAPTGKRIARHKKALVKEYYETGKIDKKKMRNLDAVQSECPTCSNQEGAAMSQYSKEQKKIHGSN